MQKLIKCFGKNELCCRNSKFWGCKRVQPHVFFKVALFLAFIVKGGVEVESEQRNPGRKYHPFRQLFQQHAKNFLILYAFPCADAPLLYLRGNIEEERVEGKWYKNVYGMFTQSRWTLRYGVSSHPITIINRSIFPPFLELPSMKQSYLVKLLTLDLKLFACFWFCLLKCGWNTPLRLLPPPEYNGGG